MSSFSEVIASLEKAKNKLENRPVKSAERSLETIRSRQKKILIGNDTIAFRTLIEGLRIGSISHTEGEDVMLVSEAPHSAFVEYGTGGYNRQADPSKQFAAPPLTSRLVKNIKAWMIIKNISPQTGSLDASAYLIARAVSNTQYENRTRHTGTPAQPFFYRPAWDYRHILVKGIKRSVRNSVS